MKEILQKCGDVGCCVGTASVQYEGATMLKAAWNDTRQRVKDILSQGCQQCTKY